MKITKTSNVNKKVWYVTSIENADSIKAEGICKQWLFKEKHIITELKLKGEISWLDVFIPDFIAFNEIATNTESMKYLLVEIDAAGIKSKYLPDSDDHGNISKYLRQISQFEIEPQYILNTEEKMIDMEELIQYSHYRILGLIHEARENYKIQSTKTISKKYNCEVFSPRKKTLENRYYSEVRSAARLNSRIINYFQNLTAFKNVCEEISLVA